MSVLSKELTIPAGEVPEDRPVLAPCIVRTQAIWAVGQWAEFITPAVYENVYSVIGHLFSDKVGLHPCRPLASAWKPISSCLDLISANRTWCCF